MWSQHTTFGKREDFKFFLVFIAVKTNLHNNERYAWYDYKLSDGNAHEKRIYGPWYGQYGNDGKILISVFSSLHLKKYSL